MNFFTIISKRDCPDGINCNSYLSWNPDGNLHYATVKKSDPVLWEITRSGNEYRQKRGVHRRLGSAYDIVKRSITVGNKGLDRRLVNIPGL